MATGGQQSVLTAVKAGQVQGLTALCYRLAAELDASTSPALTAALSGALLGVLQQRHALTAAPISPTGKLSRIGARVTHTAGCDCQFCRTLRIACPPGP